MYYKEHPEEDPSRMKSGSSSPASTASDPTDAEGAKKLKVGGQG